jgi:hypothetical protein
LTCYTMIDHSVLPWVQDVQTEGYQPEEGMFGPYDSRKLPSL